MSIVRDIETEDLAEMLEISKTTVSDFARKGMPHKQVKRKRYFHLQESINWIANNELLFRKYTHYGFYEKDKLLATGTVKELTEKLGLANQTIINYINPDNHNKSRNCYSCIKLIHQGENEMEIKIPTTEHKRFRVRANIKRQLDKHKVMIDEAKSKKESLAAFGSFIENVKQYDQYEACDIIVDEALKELENYYFKKS